MDGMSVQEAAEHLGLHPKTVRQRIKDGRLPARKIQGPRGPEWRVYPDGLPSADLGLTVDGHSVDSPFTDPAPTVDSPSIQGESAVVLEALRLVDSLRRDNQQLAGQVGFLQARVQEQERTIARLMAPQVAPTSANDVTEVQPAPPEPSAARVPWWRRFLRKEKGPPRL